MPSSKSKKSDALPGHAPGAARLLLAEDDDDVLVTLSSVLQQEGYEVTGVHSASEGRRALRSATFDLIITDLRMETETSGLDLVREAQRLDPRTAAIVLTGYGSLPSAVEALQTGVLDYITKPSKLDQLLASIKRGLEKRKLSQAELEAERADTARQRAEVHARQAMLRADISAALAERGSLRSVLDNCAEALVRHLDAAYARIWVLNPSEAILELQGTAGVAAVSGPLERSLIRLGEWEVGKAALERRPLFSDDLAHDPDFSDPDWAEREGMRYIAVYPMIVEDHVVGSIALFARQAFSPETSDNMGPLAAAIAQGIDRRRAEDERDRLLLAEREARTRAEAAERRLEQIIESLPEGVLVVDSEGRPLLWNAAAAAIGGPPPADLDVRQDPQVVLNPDGTPMTPEDAPLARAILRDEVTQGMQMKLLNSRTGLAVPVLISAAPLHDSAGNLLGGVAVYQDITMLKELEQQKEEFLSAAAHDLKTPLTSVKGLVQLLQRQLGREPGAPSFAVETLAAIDTAASRMVGLVEQLLDVSQLQMMRRIELMLDEVDLVDLVGQMLREHGRTVVNHQFLLKTDLPALVGQWDRERLERALTNLLSNAVKYSPAGGEIVVTLDEVAQDGRRWAIAAVSDQGIGIPASDLPTIFDRFKRAANVRGHIAGTGIGLSYVQEIARQHGGSVTVESVEGQGSTFILRLPCEPTAA